MAAASLTPLLIRARDAGLSLGVEDGYVVVSPSARITPELRAEFLRHKPELVELLTWSEPVADALLADAFAYLSEFFTDDPEAQVDAVNEAFASRDMFRLRCAVREWVSARVTMYRAKERDRGTAA